MRDLINRALLRATGYRLQRPAPRRARGPRRERAGRLPPDFDDEAKAIIRAVRPYTMTSPDKLFALIEATRYVAAHGIAGDVVECGVWRGGSMHAVARTLAACGDTSRDLYLFDTYEGMPPAGERDLRHDGRRATELLETLPRESKTWAVASLDDVRAGFEGVPYPRERVRFVEGRVEETVPASAPERIALLRLDTDWYESTRHELEHLYPRLSSGGVLILDDYGWWQGAREAVDEWLAETGERLLLVRAGSGRIAVKP
ncbi:MAG TPA: TylF/MycF/NovP-related O-methyltransferase [Solirubrobacteraceae bacterium]|nr:TylF/MycF/NovP-related O-methyltransferase [Solirubrobacteraceae bacterium]